jgi:di/tricarboxylate transporter
MGFCAIIGGTITLVGASPTILLNDLMVLGGKKLEPFGLFTQTPIGVCLLFSAILYFMVLGRFILPASRGEADRGITSILIGDYPAMEHPTEMHIPDSFGESRTLEDLSIRQDYLVTVVAIGNAATGMKRLVPRKGSRISGGESLNVFLSEISLFLVMNIDGFCSRCPT